MGTCNCISAKNEPLTEINHEKLEAESSNQESKVINTSDKNLPLSTELPSMRTSLPNTELLSKNFIHAVKIQAAVRGYISRKSLKKPLSKPPKPETKENQKTDLNPVSRTLPLSYIPEEALHLISVDTKNYYTSLSAFQFNETKPISNWQEALTLKDGSVYAGEWNLVGQPEGRGRMFSSDGSILEGSWKKGKLHGVARKISPRADIYLGMWQDGKMCGMGVASYINGNYHRGQWKDDLQDGFGIEVWKDGSKFIGFYRSGLKIGYGKFLWADGSCYVGQFLNDNIHGKGRYVWPNREYYGDWKDNKMHGKGFFKWDDGKSYEGDYFNGQKHGWGVFTWPHGKKYEGYWVDGKQHGTGCMTSGDKSKNGVWENGRLIKQLD